MIQVAGRGQRQCVWRETIVQQGPHDVGCHKVVKIRRGDVEHSTRDVRLATLIHQGEIRSSFCRMYISDLASFYL